MSTWRKLIINYKSISWILVAAILFITFLPAHYHLHHLFSADATTHSHNVDLHLIADISGETHHDENATIVEATPDGIVKNNNPAFSPFILIATVLIILSVVYQRIRNRPDFSDTIRKQTPPHFSPPLRAPPLV